METRTNVKIDIGCGRNKPDGYIGIDRVQIIDGKGDKKVDIVIDIEQTSLPFADDSVDEIRAMNVLEHLHDLLWVMNECHRVLKQGGVLLGIVPVAGTMEDFKDPTHARHFIKETFAYFTGSNPGLPHQPSRPKYADYGFKPWIERRLERDRDLITFELNPRKLTPSKNE